MNHLRSVSRVTFVNKFKVYGLKYFVLDFCLYTPSDNITIRFNLQTHFLVGLQPLIFIFCPEYNLANCKTKINVIKSAKLSAHSSTYLSFQPLGNYSYLENVIDVTYTTYVLPLIND